MEKISINNLDAIIFDFDGVLTDNTVYVFEDGREAVRCNRADGLGFNILREKKVPVFILSTEKNEVVRYRAEKLKLPVIQNAKDKAKALKNLADEHGYNLNKLMFVGNDLNDLSAMQIVTYPIAVADAHPSIINISWKVLSSKGGDGVVREIIESLIDFNNSN
jgi:YrbI family 3-deoxy-D-manno-octulosonate 8-phosphate phosphatase